MAPNKFEKHIKNKLEEREISPSENAWARLSEKLDAVDTQPKKSGYFFWYGIAASFIGILIISILYFNSESPIDTPDVDVVETSKEEKVETEVITIQKMEKGTEEVVVENKKVKEQPTLDIKTLDKNQIPKLKNQITSVKENETVIEEPAEKTIVFQDFKDEIIKTKILEIVATVDSLEQDNTALTNAEVDDLLRIAQDELLRDKLFNQNGSVDAMALLSEAENELDKSFRDQIFEKLKSNFLKVRTAVADRNK